ncbi:hypothetical protein BDD43_3063 [Mucilaginibacter gracilis]|uniref:Uncharacterized protein n=1 Tax=Mucilaginibacter gracilis TaxID=423350 RepID=A0A495J2E4_9SPHI|nr:hypothetical protein BDD43_3063 [Mucilaginibacter gracilis]
MIDKDRNLSAIKKFYVKLLSFFEIFSYKATGNQSIFSRWLILQQSKIFNCKLDVSTF